MLGFSGPLTKMGELSLFMNTPAGASSKPSPRFFHQLRCSLAPLPLLDLACQKIGRTPARLGWEVTIRSTRIGNFEVGLQWKKHRSQVGHSTPLFRTRINLH